MTLPIIDSHVQESASSPEVPPDCKHKDWTLGCERCFFEMHALAKGNVVVARDAAITEGAILMAWHMSLVLQASEVRLVPQLRSLDLQVVARAKVISANLQALAAHVVGVIANPILLEQALRQAAVVATSVQQRVAQTEVVATSPPLGANTMASPIVLTDAK